MVCAGAASAWDVSSVLKEELSTLRVHSMRCIPCSAVHFGSMEASSAY